ncbi:MAG: hypothetical protein R3F59_18450 [Myxococcota bacterium]
MTRASALFVWLIASSCAPAEDPACRPGFTRAGDGHCYPPPPDPAVPSANEVLEGTGPCVPRKPGDRIDVVGGCLDGACANRTFATIDAALGGGADCSTNSSGSTWICVWPQQIEGQFPVGDDDPDDGPVDGTYTGIIRARRAYDGAGPSGEGVGVSVRCWIDALGLPSEATFADVAGTLQPTELVWDRYGTEIDDDLQAVTNAALPDGVVDELTLTGPP